MTGYLDEAQVELVTVEYFRDLGYDYHHGSVLAPDVDPPERSDYGQVVLARRLRDDVIPYWCAIHLRTLQSFSLKQGNRKRSCISYGCYNRAVCVAHAWNKGIAL